MTLTMVCWAAALMTYGLVPADGMGDPVVPERDREVLFVLFMVIGALVLGPRRVDHGLVTSVLITQILLHATMVLLSRRFLMVRRSGGLRKCAVYIAGAGPMGRRVAEILDESPQSGVEIVGFLDDEVTEVEGRTEPVLGRLDDLGAVIENYPVSDIIVALSLRHTETIREITNVAELHGLRVRLVPDYFFIFGTERVQTSAVGEVPIVNVNVIPLDSARNRAIKRLFDIVFSSALLLLASPLLVGIGLLVRLTSEGSALYTPYRLGRNARPFKCYKFRTMESTESLHPTTSTRPNDPRITRVGKYLRRWSFDELPQFVNVLKGDMSVVGPRPHRISLNTEFQQQVSGYMIRHYVRPGITGWAQVNGWRGPTDTMERKVQRTIHDLWYVYNWSLWLDVRIVFRTLFVLKGR